MRRPPTPPRGAVPRVAGLTRRQMLQAAGFAGIGAALLPSLTACAPGRRADGVVRFATNNDPVWVPHYQALAREFEAENPDARIDISYIPEGALDAWLVARTAAGQAPDIVELGVSAVSRYSRNGTAIDISGFLEPGFADTYIPVVRNLISRDDAVYGVPKVASCMTIYYDTAIVERLGARIPTGPDDGWTWDEFRELCVGAQEITGAYGVSYGYVNANSGNRWLPALYQRGGALFGSDGKPSMLTDAAYDALEWTRGFYADRLISPSNTIKASQSDTAGSLFTTGQVGFMVHEAQAPLLRDALDDDQWGQTFMFRDQDLATNLGGSINVVTSSSPQPELAARFLAFASGREATIEVARQTGSVAPFVGLSPEEVGYDYRPEDLGKATTQLQSVPDAVGNDMATRDYQTVREVLGDSLDLLMIGSQGVEETAQMIDRGLANA